MLSSTRVGSLLTLPLILAGALFAACSDRIAIVVDAGPRTDGAVTPTDGAPDSRGPSSDAAVPDGASRDGAIQAGWSKRAPLLASNSEMAVAELDGKIYVIGGYPSTRVSVNTVQVYDAASDKWSLATPLPVALNHAVAAAANKRVYVMGGQKSSSGSGPFLDTVYEYDPSAKTWAARASMPTARGGGAAGVIGDDVYVAGGRPPRGTDFAVYNAKRNAWTALPAMPTQRNHIGAGAIGGKIYVVGGRFGAGFSSTPTAALEMYDPGTKKWTTRAPMPTVRGGVNAVEARGCLFVFGGEGPGATASGGVFKDNEAYNPKTNKWQRLDPIPIPVHGVTGAAFIAGWIHLVGGGTRSGGSSGATHHQIYRLAISCL